MTKIKKLHHKRLNFPPQEVQQLREQLEAVPAKDIYAVLDDHKEWAFVRGDMYHWIPVLNRFDEILMNVCQEYELAGLQKADFDSNTQRTLVGILHFSRLLLENCINRNLYSSVDRLDSLLNTSDPEVLEFTLRLLLRTSQRWSYQRDLKAHQAVMSSRLTTLADPWNAKKDMAPPPEQAPAEAVASHTNEFKLLARDAATEALMGHGGTVRFQFFRTAEDVRMLESEQLAAASPDTRKKPSGAGSSSSGLGGGGSSSSGGGVLRTPPAKKSRAHSQLSCPRPTTTATEGLVSISAPVSSLGLDPTAGICGQMRQAMDRLVERYRVPPTHRYELRHRVFVALAFARGDCELRYRLLRSRIYAVAVLSQLMNEQEFKNMLQSREPNFTADIVGVLQPEVHAPLGLQTAVLLALESLLKQRGEVSGAYVALNASANHGVLMFTLRKAFTNAAGPPVYPYEFMSALYFFLTGMANNMNGGQLLVSAGVVPVFVSALRHTHPQQLRSSGRVAKLLDCLITSTPAAFPAFCSANGLAALVDRMRDEVQRAVAACSASPAGASDLSSPVTLPRFCEYPKQLYRRREILSAEQIFLLKELFKLLSRLLQQSTYQDRLRNLVETTLPETLRTVLSHPAAFGTNIYGLAISISAMLVHNEPTSLPIIQEARIPEAMLENLERHIPYNSDVIMYIPAALGAFCLNDAGLEQVRKSTVVRNTLGAFSDPDFIRVLQDGDTTGSFGASLDEFVRHFPAVRDEIMDEVIAMLKNVLAMGAADSPLVALNPGNTFLLRTARDEELKHHLDDLYGMMLESVTTFLEGLLEQRAQGEMFMQRGGWALIVQAIRSPLLPFGFIKSRTFESLHGLSSTLLDTSQEGVFKVLFAELGECMQKPTICRIGDGGSDDTATAADAAAYVALADPSGLSAGEYTALHVKLHNTTSAIGAIALITYLINGSGGGSLTRCVKDITDIMPADDFVRLVGSMCTAYCGGIQRAVAIEHTIAMLPDASAAEKADAAPSAKGKEVEGHAPTRQAMDVDEGSSPGVEAFVRTNCLNLGEVAIGFTLEAGEFIEGMSNSLGLGAKRGEDEAAKITAPLVAELVKFVHRMLELCAGAERTVVGAQLVDQAMVAIMKTLVFARHRIYLKLLIFTVFVEEHGLEQFCRVLESMWAWAASLPPEDAAAAAAAAAASKPAKPSPEARLRKILDATLESMLSILSFILDGEPVVECPDFAALCHEHNAQQGWFRSGDFVVGVRLKALPTLQRIWESALLIRGNGNLVQAFIACLAPLLYSRQEARTAIMGVGLNRHLDGLLGERRTSQGPGRGPGAQTPIPLISRVLGRWSPLTRTPLLSEADAELEASASAAEPNAALVAELVGMGFSTEDAVASLRQRDGNLARAANYLLSVTVANRAEQGPDRDGSTRGNEPAGAEATSSRAQGDRAAGDGAGSDQPAEQGGAAGETDAQQAEGMAPMAVDDVVQLGGNDESAASRQGPSESEGVEPEGVEPKGVEPFNSKEWREAREADEDAQREQLKQVRDALRASIAPRAVALVDEFKDKAVAHVRGVLVLVLGKDGSDAAVHVLLNAFTPLLIAAGTGSCDEDERLAAHAHLWAMLLSIERLMSEIRPHAGRIAPHLVRALEAAGRREGRAPTWLTAVVLVVEQLLQRDDEPPKVKRGDREELHRIARQRLTKLPPAATTEAAVAVAAAADAPSVESGALSDEQPPESGAQPLRSAFELLWEAGAADGTDASARADGAQADGAQADGAQADGAQADGAQAAESETVFDAEAVRELQQLATQFFATPVPVYGPAELNALLRLVVVLTRDFAFASAFLESGGLASVLRTMRAQPADVAQSIGEAAAAEKSPLAFVNAVMAVPKDRQRAQRQERTLVAHVLRHAIESQPTLRLIMENLIHGWFESPQLTSADVTTYVRSTLAYALRNPALYTRVTADRCFLPSYSNDMRTSWMTLAWRSTRLMDEDEVDRYEALPLDEDGSPKDGADSDFLAYLEAKKRDPPFTSYELDDESERLACRIVEFVADEIMALRPPGAAPPVSRTSTAVELQALATPSKPRTSGSVLAAAGDDEPETVAYRCFLMQCLSELIASFPFALRAVFAARTSAPVLLSPRRPRGKAPAVPDEGVLAASQPALRVRAPLISHLVHDLIVREATNSARLPQVRGAPEEPRGGTELDRVVAVARLQAATKRAQLSRSVTFWATALLSTMCVRHQEGWTTTAPRDAAPPASEISLASLAGSYDRTLLAARQLVLDHIVRAFRECLSATAAGTGGMDIIYARLTSLAHLAYKLVIARPISHGRPADTRAQGAAAREDPSTLKRMLLERGVLDLLTAASSRLNLNHPQSREMLSVFLRPMEHLAKAAVKLSREAVLSAWEESGQDRMPQAAGQRGFSMELLDDDGGALIDEDEDIPPDLYVNSALGLHQNQRVTAGHAGDDQYSEDDLMEEDYDDEMYDDGNSSVSDIDSDDEAMDEDITLDHDAPGDSDSMEMDAIMREGGDELDPSDSSGDEGGYSSPDAEHHSGVDYGSTGDGDNSADESDSDHDSGDDSDDDEDDNDGDDGDDDDDVGDDLRASFRLALGGAMRLLQDDDEQALDGEGADVEFYGSGLDGDAAGSSADEHASGSGHGDGWRNGLTGAHAAALASLGRHIVHHHNHHHNHHRLLHHGRSRPGSAGLEPPIARGGRDGSRVGSAAGDRQSGPENDSGASSDESSDDSDSFADGFSDHVEVTMEAIDEHGNPESIRRGILPTGFLDTFVAGLGDGRMPSAIRAGVPLRQMAHGRPLGAVNGMAADVGAAFEFSLPRLSALGRPGLSVGGVGAAGQSMAHPLLERGEHADRSGLQARAERVARGSLSGPLGGVPDDVYELGQPMAARLSQAFSSGRRPAYTHQMIPGPSNRAGPTPWTQEGSSEGAPRDGTVEGALEDPGSPAAVLLEQLARMSRATSAIDGYIPLSTIERWQEEARMQFGAGAATCAPWIANTILNTLIPEAICQNLLKARYQAEVMRRTAIVDRKRMEDEDEERRRREESARAEEDARLRAEDAKSSTSDASAAENMVIDGGGEDEGEGEGEAGQAEGPAEPEPEPEPVFVNVNGERIEITDTGIDPEFLLALPDDLRMEVIENRREELRIERRAAGATPAAAGVPADDPEGFIQEFLNALPAEIRDEVMENGPLQRQLLELEGQLGQRRTVGSGGAWQLPPAQAGGPESRVSAVDAAVRARMQIGASSARGRQQQGAVGGEDGSTEQGRVRERRRKKIAARDIAVQLLSRAELTALTRFIFLPNHAVSGALTAKIVQYVCENGRTRSQFIHLMLAVLESCATTLEDVDAVIRQALDATHPADQVANADGSSAAAAPPAADVAPKAPQRPPTRGGGELADPLHVSVLGTPMVTQFTASLVQQQSPEFSFPLGELLTDVPAYVPAQRCLDALHSLATHNARAAMHFLVEHSPARPHGGEDGDEDRFPVVYLLRLLAKPLYYSHGNAIPEMLMQLLSAVTKPLGSMMRRSQQLLHEQSLPQQPEEGEAGATGEGGEPRAGGSAGADAPADKHRCMVQLPGIPDSALRAIVNVLAAGECTSRTFQHTLSLIQNLSHLPGVLPIVTDELIQRASELSASVRKDITQLLDMLQSLPRGLADEGDGDAPAGVSADLLDKVRDITLAKFSPASSHQSRLLRLLMAIDYISTTVAKRLEEKRRPAADASGRQRQAAGAGAVGDRSGMDIDAESADEALSAELLHLRSLSLGHSARFLPLWEAMGQCLQCTSAQPELAHVATVLLPLIESFMVVFKPIVGEKSRVAAATAADAAEGGSVADGGAQVSPASQSTQAASSPSEAYFQSLTEKHKKVLNTLVRNNPGLLSGSFSLLVYNPHVLDFDNKRSYFYQRLHDDSGGAGGGARRGSARPLGGALQVNVHRRSVFEDSYHQFAGKSGDEIRRARINVKFHNEEGVDAGGVSREWFQVLARQMFNPDYALFMPSAAGRVTYQPNPQSWANPEHLLYFKFVGRIIGKAIVDQRALDAYFTRSFYKHILGRKVDYRDIEAIDPSYYKSLEWILENDITDVFEETFSIEVDDFGQHRIVDLVPNGQEINVTEENKAEYVRLVTEQRLYRAIKDQIKAFLSGFHDVIPGDLIQIFNEQELELLISGMPDIDVDDWRNNTVYHGGYSSSSAQIQWFWRAVRMFDHEERAKLLQFVTGTSKVPLEGFAHLQGNQGVQKFQIHKDFSIPARLPTAHTCFNQLDLPLYDSFEALKQSLLLAISECSTGFGFV
ncbi:E3 ubiquitin-protein ligase tom1 [Coemansia biformis]|uniref:HECT-type E3 ubiquitin transferase n=1 Tax=Coemansia biformis TaxID=1286918 RepID=A0A9W8CYA0_9FUNG|nr:E3 ubiquitin-protein ligase tom1 [Coemansia biformis]